MDFRESVAGRVVMMVMVATIGSTAAILLITAEARYRQDHDHNNVTQPPPATDFLGDKESKIANIAEPPSVVGARPSRQISMKAHSSSQQIINTKDDASGSKGPDNLLNGVLAVLRRHLLEYPENNAYNKDTNLVEELQNNNRENEEVPNPHRITNLVEELQNNKRENEEVPTPHRIRHRASKRRRRHFGPYQEQEHQLGVDKPAVCNLNPEQGRCKALIKRYYFNPKSGKCEEFTYGGCGGNGNNFETMEDCNHMCLISTDTIIESESVNPLDNDVSMNDDDDRNPVLRNPMELQGTFDLNPFDNAASMNGDDSNTVLKKTTEELHQKSLDLQNYEKLFALINGSTAAEEMNVLRIQDNQKNQISSINYSGVSSSHQWLVVAMVGWSLVGMLLIMLACIAFFYNQGNHLKGLQETINQRPLLMYDPTGSHQGNDEDDYENDETSSNNSDKKYHEPIHKKTEVKRTGFPPLHWLLSNLPPRDPEKADVDYLDDTCLLDDDLLLDYDDSDGQISHESLLNCDSPLKHNNEDEIHSALLPRRSLSLTDLSV